jgi:hypothetical protein
MRIVGMATLALVGIALSQSASAQTRCNTFGGMTTCRDADGNTSQTTSFGGMTTTRRSDGVTYETTTNGNMTTIRGSDGSVHTCTRFGTQVSCN